MQRALEEAGIHFLFDGNAATGIVLAGSHP